MILPVNVGSMTQLFSGIWILDRMEPHINQHWAHQIQMAKNLAGIFKILLICPEGSFWPMRMLHST